APDHRSRRRRLLRLCAPWCLGAGRRRVLGHESGRRALHPDPRLHRDRVARAVATRRARQDGAVPVRRNDRAVRARSRVARGQSGRGQVSAPGVDLAERKALLVTRTELDRARIMLAAREIRAIVAPASPVEPAARYRPVSAMLMSVLGPTVGTSRLGSWLRVAWIALAALRVLRTLR